MSTVAEIKEAIKHLSQSERREIQNWLVDTRSKEKRLTDDGFDIEETHAKLEQAAKGTFRKVNPKEQIHRLMATLE